MSFHEIDQLRFEAEKRRDVLSAIFAYILLASIVIGTCFGALAYLNGWAS